MGRGGYIGSGASATNEPGWDNKGRSERADFRGFSQNWFRRIAIFTAQTHMNLAEEVVGADDGWTAEENAALQLLLSDFPEKDADGKRVRALFAVLQPSLYITRLKAT